MKTFYKVTFFLVVIVILNFFVNMIFTSKNKASNFVDTYINSEKSVKVLVHDIFFDEKISHTTFYKFSIFFKGIFGNSKDFTFKDNFSGKFFKIMRFDQYGKEFRSQQTSLLENEELFVKVDPLQLNDSSFGTKENPVLIFWYKGANKELMTEITLDEKGIDSTYINKEYPLASTKEEYRYNVEQYLTYIMPKEEFKKRFDKQNK